MQNRVFFMVHVFLLSLILSWMPCKVGLSQDLQKICSGSYRLEEEPYECGCPNYELVVLKKELNDCLNGQFSECQYWDSLEYYCMQKCPDKNFIRDRDGICHPCDDTHSFYPNDENACHLCQGRLSIDGLCVLNCPTDKPLLRADLECVSCKDEDMYIKIVNDNCSLCPNRHQTGAYCIQKMEKSKTKPYDLFERLEQKGVM